MVCVKSILLKLAVITWPLGHTQKKMHTRTALVTSGEDWGQYATDKPPVRPICNMHQWIQNVEECTLIAAVLPLRVCVCDPKLKPVAAAYFELEQLLCYRASSSRDCKSQTIKPSNTSDRIERGGGQTHIKGRWLENGGNFHAMSLRYFIAGTIQTE